MPSENCSWGLTGSKPSSSRRDAVSDRAARPKYSLIVATRNRAQRLGACLDSIAAANGIRQLAELVIVDNGSTDETSSVIDHFVNRTTGLQVRLVSVPRPGLSRARNAGVRASTADFLIFTDDDCYLDGEYFTNLEQSIANNSFDYFSGNILLYRETYSPEGGFLKKDHIEHFKPGLIPAPGHLQGSNMGFSRRIFDRIGEFNVLIGAGTPFRFEDIEFAARASLAGFEGVHLPDVQVVHDHGREDGSKEREKIVRENALAAGAYCCELFLLDGRRALGYCASHWRRLLSGLDGGTRRLRFEILGAVTFLQYLLRNRIRPKLNQSFH